MNTAPGDEEHEHFAALWAAMEFRLQYGTWGAVLGPRDGQRATGRRNGGVLEFGGGVARECTLIQ